MALVWGLSRLLTVDEEELRSRVQWANQQTFAPFLGLYHSIAPILGLAHSSEAPPSPVIDEPSLFGASPLAKQLPLSQVQLFEQNPEQLDSAAISPTCASLDTTLESAEKELLLFTCEQSLCGKGEGLRLRAIEQNEDASAGDVQAAESTAGSSTTSSMVQLDRDCFSQILAHVDNSTLQACSLVCRDFLEISSFARTRMSLQKAPHIAVLPALLTRFCKLKTLHLNGLPDPLLAEPAGLGLDDAMMAVVARCCRTLRELRLDQCSAFSDAGLALVLSACTELADLRLVHCGGFKGEAFTGLRCSVQRLEMDSCQALTNEGLSTALSSCPQLAEFGLLTREGGACFAQGLERAAKFCGGLRKLELHGCGIRDETLLRFSASCPDLNDVSISSEPCITDRGLANFFSGLVHLDVVNLDNNRLLTRVPPFPPSLKSLSLGCCLRACDLALRQVAELTTLQELSLDLCPFLSDASVEAIFARCRGLRRLVLVADVSLTVETIRALATSGSKVRLHVKACPGIKPECVSQEAKEVLANVQVEQLE